VHDIFDQDCICIVNFSYTTIIDRHFIYRMLSLAFIHATKVETAREINPPELMSKSVTVTLTLYIYKQHLIYFIINIKGINQFQGISKNDIIHIKRSKYLISFTIRIIYLQM